MLINLKVAPWCVDDPKTAFKFVSMHVDALVSNAPDKVVNVVKRRV